MDKLPPSVGTVNRYLNYKGTTQKNFEKRSEKILTNIQNSKDLDH